MLPFDFQPITRIVFGAGKVDSLGELARELGARRAMVVSDPGVIAAGHAQHGVDSLRAAGIEATCFEGVHENPTTKDVDAGLAFARDFQPDLLVGLGGGSSMDCAKGVNFLYTNGGRMQDYWGVGKAQKPMLPMIAVPTTAGTGSEAQSFALISDADTRAKMACGDKKAACRIAILDPVLTLTQPARVTAQSGIDAISHALETYVTRDRNAVSLAFSRQAWSLLAEHFGRVLEDPGDLEARGGMQLGACFGGLAIENSMLGATHALANSLTARYDVPHGQAIAIMLPHVIRFNGAKFPHWYADLMRSSSSNGSADSRGGPEELARLVASLVERAGLTARLSECGVERERLPEMADDAARQWTATFNPRPVGRDELLELYNSAY